MKKHHTAIKTAAALGLLISTPLVQAADTFTGFSMDFVGIANAGNVADDSGHGAVDYNYRMGVHEVSRGMIDAYNAVGANPTITIQDMAYYGGNGVNRPATGVSWNEAARFVNWLNTSKGYSPAYKASGAAYEDIELWTTGDAGFNPANPFRNSNAYYFMPNEDEWYKAAYYDPNASTYNDYATGSDTAPTAVASGTTSGTAVYDQSSRTGPADITNAGGLSPYGTMAQSGNVYEWSESGHNGDLFWVGGNYLFRGGYWDTTPYYLQSHERGSASGGDWNHIGFRVAAVPEPSGVTLLVIGAVGLMMKRRRG